MHLRRIDITAEQLCNNTAACPAVFENADGDFLIIGTESTNEVIPHLPIGSGCADYERVIKVPRAVILDAAKNLG